MPLFLDEKTNEFSILLSKPNRSRGIFLADIDLYVLKRICDHKILSSQAVHKLYLYFQASRKKQSITNRITRLVEKNILVRKEAYSSKKTFYRQNYYTLSAKGYLALEIIGYLERGYSERVEIARIPSDHNEFASENMIELSLQFDDILDAEKVVRGTQYALFDRRIAAIPVIPDYIVEHANRLFCLEFDVGTELLSHLTNKTHRYYKLHEQGHFKEFQPFIVYVIKDNNGQPQQKRIQNIKAAHYEFYERLHTFPVYVVSERDFADVLARLLTKQYPISSSVANMVNIDIAMFYQQKYRVAHGWDSERVSIERLLSNAETAIFYPPSHIVKYFTYRGTFKSQIYVTQEVGSVLHYLQVTALLREFDITRDTLFIHAYLPLELVLTYPYVSNSLVSTQRLGIQPPISVILQSELEVLDVMEQLEGGEDIVEKPLQYFVAERAYSLQARKG